MMEMRTVVLSDQVWDEVYPGVRRRVVGGERMTLTTYEFGPGGRFPMHSHPQEQMVLVRKGSITFANGTQSITLLPNHALVIPPGVSHDATAGDDGALLVSVVAPARRSMADYTIEEPA
jgi:quercetin dioxygenase-like cupin family protein